MVFSIVMPVYNVISYLNQAVQSVVEQSFTDWEIILIDDGSTDGSSILCDDWSEKDARISVIHKSNQGLSAARNDGIQLAKGQYILFIDSDDTIAPNCLDKIDDIVRKDPSIDIIMGKYIRCCSNGKKIYPKFHFDSKEFANSRNCINYLFEKIPESIWNVWRYIYRRNYILSNDFYFKEGIYCEDVEWLPRVLLKAQHFFYYDEPFYFYQYKRTGSIMQVSGLKRYKDLIDSIKSSLNTAIKADCSTDALQNALVKEYIVQFSYFFTVSKLERKSFKEYLKNNDFLLNYGTSDTIHVFSFLYHFIGLNSMIIVMTSVRFFYHKYKKW